jgi:type II secretory pathway pseudopilin PulG
MQTTKSSPESGNVLICSLIAIVIVSLIAANVLSNSATRFNAASNQVRAWKQALQAAEAGGEMAFTELRKQTSTDATVRASQWSGWTNSGSTHTSPQTTFGSSNLITQTTVETFYFDASGVFHIGANPDPSQNNWYRLRSKGTAPLPNIRRTGMDDALVQDGQKHFAALGSTQMKDIVARGKGDSLLRKIDFNYDHFVSTYGPNGDGLNRLSRPSPRFLTRPLKLMASSMDLAPPLTSTATIRATVRMIRQ